MKTSKFFEKSKFNWHFFQKSFNSAFSASHRPYRLDSDQKEQAQFRVNRAMYWFLLAWGGLVYSWGLVHLLAIDPKIYKCWYNHAQFDTCPALNLVSQDNQLGSVAGFTILMVLFVLFLWRLQAATNSNWRTWLYFVGQLGAVLLMVLIIRQDNVILSLYLALALEAITILTKPILAISVAAGLLILFVLSDVLSRGTFAEWNIVIFRIWSSTDYAALSLFLVGYLILYFQLSRTHHWLIHTHQELAIAHVQLKASSEQIEALTLLNERQRLARELHDTLAQGLVGLTFQLETVDGLLSLERPGEAQQIVQQAMSKARTTLAEAREVISNLRNQTSPGLSLYQNVVQELAHFKEFNPIECVWDIEALSLVNPAFHLPVWRFISEGLTNVLKHSQARHLWVKAWCQEGWLYIEIKDDGVGFEMTKALHQPGHYGLVGLEERANLAQGRVNITSEIGAGTILQFSLLLKENLTGSEVAQ